MRVRFTSYRSFCDDVDRGDIRQVAKAEAQVGTNLLAEFEGKVAEPAAAAAEVVTAEAAAATAEAATPVEAAAVTDKVLTAEPRVSLHVCCQSVHAIGSQGPWCASCQGQVHSEEHCSQVVRKNGGNELTCKSRVQFQSGNRPYYEQWSQAATVATSEQAGGDMGTTGGPIPSDALVRVHGKEQLAGETFLVDLDKNDTELATVMRESLGLRGGQMAEDGNCQFNSIASTVFNDSSTEAGHMARRLLCTWVEEFVTHEVEGMLPAQSTKEQLLAGIGKYEARVGPEHHGDEDTCTGQQSRG